MRVIIIQKKYVNNKDMYLQWAHHLLTIHNFADACSINDHALQKFGARV